MSRLYSVAAVRYAEQRAVESGTPEYDLMLDAGRQAADLIDFHYPHAVRFLVFCGGGNNGGDALVAASVLHLRYHREVLVYALKPLNKLSGCAAFAASSLPETVELKEAADFSTRDIHPGDVIIDGILGIGFEGGSLRPAVAELIAKINSSSSPVVALDLPSGMDGDSGRVSPDGVIDADLTICFGMVKSGLFSGDASRYRGDFRFADIGLDAENDSNEEVFTNFDAVSLTGRPGFDCHKNSRGRVLVWGGSDEYPGAPVLTSVAALRCGAGIVRLVSEGECSRIAPAELIVKKIPNGSALSGEVMPVFELSDVLAAGCGWGGRIPVEALELLHRFPGKVVLDADALNMFSRHPEMWNFNGNLIITPHPGEAKRLAEAFGVEYSSCRREFAVALAKRLNCVVILKGRDSIVADCTGRNTLIAAGNHALATAGSGDVLTGIIAALLASDMLPLFETAALGAYIHGVAGESADGIPLAGDLPESAGRILTALRHNHLV